MKNVFKITGGLLLLLFTTPGCEKLNDKELLTDHIWKFKEITTSSTNPNIASIVSFTNALMTNATMEFKTNGTYVLTAMNQTATGTWELSDDGKSLTIDPVDGEVDVMKVAKLTKTDLILEGEEIDSTYGAYSVTMHWVK